ncbi:hypothetical protein IEQ34_004149 [Dendrobium chrysotoxum]|uniref:Uncharacterized protein n=1 Tax=Dendrobium chrysotoxum TaxID=161865 RepID=A0AAV7HE61_DENCH|nr:hypothetical protein IEQ34_004149 [Dendrobium chrysotoxum]
MADRDLEQGWKSGCVDKHHAPGSVQATGKMDCQGGTSYHDTSDGGDVGPRNPNDDDPPSDRDGSSNTNCLKCRSLRRNIPCNC